MFKRNFYGTRIAVLETLPPRMSMGPMQFTGRHDRIMRLFGKNLKKARERCYPTASAFAGKLGIEPHTYRTYERGTSEPNFETLTRICEDLGITPNDLLPGASGERRPSQTVSAA